MSGRWLSMVAMVTFGLLVLPPTVAEAAAGEPCPNESLRSELNDTFLPDCRAYEMVTPAYEEGHIFDPEGYSSNGERVILGSFAGVAGAVGAGEEALQSDSYVATRGTQGWSLTPMNPPLSRFVGQLALAVEANSGLSLWDQHTPRQPAVTRDMYIRSPEGVYTYLGRLNPTPGLEGEESNAIETSEKDYDRPVAGTSDYSHVVLFASEGIDYWSGFDNTKGEAGSVYEYSGVTSVEHEQPPVLVGVTGAKGSASLVGECGTQPGSGQEGSMFNALSGDGETVFVTVQPAELDGCPAGAVAPAQREIYARLHGARSSGLPAETVHVSESECTVECGSEDSGKEFEGASENGEKAFFTSTQKLTDDATDATANGNAAEGQGCAVARGGGGCNLYEFDFAGEHGHALRLVAGGDEVLGVVDVADDGSRVYFVAEHALASAGKNVYGREAQEGQPNLYVYDSVTGRTMFIATLSESDELDWNRWWEFRSARVELTGGGGQFLLFGSVQPGVVPGEESTAGQLYEYDAETAELVRVSKGEDSYNDNGLNSSTKLGVIQPERVDFRSSSNDYQISENGRTVVFETSGELSPLAVSALKGCSSVYEFRSGAGPLADGSVHLVSDGRDVEPGPGGRCYDAHGAQFLAMDGEGENILFATDDSLLPADTDGGQRSIYDARAGGGFAPAPAAAGAGCAGGCEAPVSAPPVAGGPATGRLGGAGNLAPPVAKAPPAARKKKPRHRTVRRGCVRHRRGRCAKRRGRSRVAGRVAGGRAGMAGVSGNSGRGR